MTRDDIIRMAREVDLHERVKDGVGYVVRIPNLEKLERFAALVAAAEREACAEICERRKSLYWMEADKTGLEAARAAAIASEECAAAIRARSA